MGTEVFPCPQCSQLNTTRRTTCKNCGTDLTQSLVGNYPLEKPIEKATKGRPISYLSIILGVVIFLIISVLALYWLVSWYDSLYASSNYPRAVGSGLSSTIYYKHANYLKDGTDYTASDVVADTQYSGDWCY